MKGGEVSIQDGRNSETLYDIQGKGVYESVAHSDLAYWLTGRSC